MKKLLILIVLTLLLLTVCYCSLMPQGLGKIMESFDSREPDTGHAFATLTRHLQ